MQPVGTKSRLLKVCRLGGFYRDSLYSEIEAKPGLRISPSSLRQTQLTTCPYRLVVGVPTAASKG
jgi:hypothetical protein